jgi:hypothetical protein
VKQFVRYTLFAAIMAALTPACAPRAGRSSLAQPQDLYTLQVDGEPVSTAGDVNLLEVLRRKYTPLRLGEYASAEDRPLVIVDGVIQTGLYRLADMPAFHVANVQRLSGPEAMLFYGARARAGAIIVKTRQTDPRP